MRTDEQSNYTKTYLSDIYPPENLAAIYAQTLSFIGTTNGLHIRSRKVMVVYPLTDLICPCHRESALLIGNITARGKKSEIDCKTNFWEQNTTLCYRNQKNKCKPKEAGRK